MMSWDSGFWQQHRKLTAEFAVPLGGKKQAFSVNSEVGRGSACFCSVYKLTQIKNNKIKSPIKFNLCSKSRFPLTFSIEKGIYCLSSQVVYISS